MAGDTVTFCLSAIVNETIKPAEEKIRVLLEDPRRDLGVGARRRVASLRGAMRPGLGSPTVLLSACTARLQR